MKITLCYTRGRGYSFSPLKATVFSMKYCSTYTNKAPHLIVRMSSTCVWIGEPSATCWLDGWTSGCVLKTVKGIGGRRLTQPPCFFPFVWWCEHMDRERTSEFEAGQSDRSLSDQMKYVSTSQLANPTLWSSPMFYYPANCESFILIVWFPWCAILLRPEYPWVRCIKCNLILLPSSLHFLCPTPILRL